jgi:hypothetical protein
MDPNVSRRSLLGASLGASLGLARIPAPFREEGVQRQSPDGVFSVKDFGAKGDGATDDAGAFQTAIDTAAKVGGLVVVPFSPANYIIGSPLTLAPNVSIQGGGGQSPTLRLASGVPVMFTWVGNAEASHLHASILNLTLESGASGSGTAIHVRNFNGLYVRHVSINHFNMGVVSNWGIGLNLYACSFVHLKRGLNVGGSGAPGGLRPGLPNDPFMDTVVVDGCGFAQNELDINDMGSSKSLGGIIIRDCSLFEAWATPVTAKRFYIRIANRKGVTISGNWFESGLPSRTCIYLGNVDHDGNQTKMCHGAAIFGNMVLQTAKTGTIGVDLAACDGAAVFGNCFEFAPGNHPVRLAGTAGPESVGQNAFLTYPDQPEYANPVGR